MGDMFVPTRREAPADAVLPSHKLLVRGGLIRTVCVVARACDLHTYFDEYTHGVFLCMHLILVLSRPLPRRVCSPLLNC